MQNWDNSVEQGEERIQDVKIERLKSTSQKQDHENQNRRFMNLDDDDSCDELFGNLFKEIKADSPWFCDQDFKYVFRSKKFNEKSGNTSRKLMEILLTYFSQFTTLYPEPVGKKIAQFCKKLKAWHEEQKRNVFKFDQLVQFFVSIHEMNPEYARITRQAFNTKLRKYAVTNLMNPRCQVKDKVHYLRVAKIYAIRCRSQALIERNQSR